MANYGTVLVPILPGSDGDPTHQPTGTTHRIFDPPTIYLERLADLWMRERNEHVKGVTYILDRLPHGYTVWGRPRSNNPKHIDRWAFGHPGRKTFDSPNRFFPHFLHLMNNGGSNIGCTCTVCIGSASRATPKAKSAATPLQPAFQKFKGKPRQVDTSSQRTDDEGTPDIYRNLIDKLRRDGRVDEKIKETMSLDWRAERKLLPSMLDQLPEQPQWIPRPGELVLFVRNLTPGVTEISYDDTAKEFKVWSRKLRRFDGYPRWEAGVITQAATEQARVEDLVMETDKVYQRNYSGFRVEPLPDPNSTVKYWTKQHKYLALHSLRPFIFCEEFLRGIPKRDRHPTITHAFTVMSSFSLLERHRFKGTWPTASISCKGIYMGSELLVVGDLVRLMPRGQGSTVTDVLKITSINLKLMNLDTASDDDYDGKHPYNSAVHVTGKAFTTDPNRAASRIPISGASKRDLPMLEAYDEEWYWLHEAEKSLRIPFSRIMGRSYEAEAMALWFPHLTADHNDIGAGPAMSKGVEGIHQARAYSSNHYLKVERGRKWFWGDTRAEALDVGTVNGQEVGKHDRSRDAKTWRRLIKVLEGSAGLEDKLALKKAALADRPLGRPSQNNALVTSARRAIDAEDGMSRDAGTEDVDMDDEAADQFVEEMTGGMDHVGLAQSDEEAESSPDVVMLDEVPTSKKQRRLEIRLD